ncbi:MAG: type II secretion system F family protein [Candidatus Diapherotrites archaeon]
MLAWIEYAHAFIEKRKRKQYVQQVVTGIEPFLSSFALELSIHSHPETALEKSIPFVPFPMQEELRRVLHRVEMGGLSLEESIGKMITQLGSKPLTQSGSVLVHVLKSGITAEGMRALHQTIENVRLHEQNAIQRYGEMLTLYALVFIAVSALVPAFVLSFATIGSAFLEVEWEAWHLLGVAWILFPILDIFVLAIVWETTPLLVRGIDFSSSDKNFLVQYQEWKNHMDCISTQQGIEGGYSRVLISSALEGSGFFIIGWSAYLYFHPTDITFFILLGLAALFPWIANCVFIQMKHRNRIHSLENQMPDSLLMWASLPRTIPFTESLVHVMNATPSPLHEEWKRVHQLISKGSTVPRALQELGKGLNSSLLSRTRHVLLQTYASGHPLDEPCMQLARDAMMEHNATREREAMLMIEKYTILGAGGLLIPLLLGLTTGMVAQLSFSSGGTTTTLQETATLAAMGYLFIYALIASMFAGVMNGSWKKGFSYVIWLVPLNQLLWHIGRYLAGA